ncbi:MAG: hypothetical protein VZR09_10270 [Candidatus Gastranaerophilaceae bacterium]|nr:hypothetical protein [Candidatus Gastranaerophilaceae bacterium]
METTKMTKVQKFTELIDKTRGLDFTFDVEEFLNHEIELASRKKSTGKSKKQIEDDNILKDRVLAALAAVDEPIRVNDLVKRTPDLMANYAPQKVTSMLTKLVNSKAVNRTVKGKVTTYSIAE